MTASWLALLPAIVGVFLLWTVTGCIVLFAAGVREVRVYPAAPLVACAAIGLLTFASPPFAWSLGMVVAGVGALCVMVLAIRLLAFREGAKRALDKQLHALRDSWAALDKQKAIGAAIGIVLNAAVSFWLFSSAVGSPEFFLQNYDSSFHHSVVRYIVHSGNASPVGAGSVTGAPNDMYPDLWHAFAALVVQTVGVSVPVGVWVVTLALLMFALPLSTCVLVSNLFPSCSPFTLVLAAVIPSMEANSVAGFVTWGPLFANLGGMVLLPMALALIMQAFASSLSARGVAARVSALVACLFGLGLFHPNTVIMLTVFLLPLFIWRCKALWARVGLVGLFVACWLGMAYSPLFMRTVNCLDRLADDVELGMAYAESYGLDYAALASTDYFVPAVGAIMLAAAVLVAVILKRRWNNSWYVVGVAIVAFQYFATLFPSDWLSIVATGFWYRDCFRLSMAMRFFALIGIVVIPEVLVRFIISRQSLPRAASIITRAAVVIITCIGSAWVCYQGVDEHGMMLNEDTTYVRTLPDPDAFNPQKEAFSQLVAEEVGDAVVLNNFNDASVWLYPIYGVNALIKGKPANQMSSMDDDLYTVISGIDRYGDPGESGEEVREAARRLGLEYLVKVSNIINVTTRFSDGGAVSYETADAVTRVDESTPGFDLVFEQDGMYLYRLIDLADTSEGD